MAAYVQMNNICKQFPGVKALDGVNFSLEKGKVHALLGENGAGKSTLMKILAGMLQPTSGEILIDGKRVTISNPKDAMNLSIAMVYQQFTLSPELTVLENIVLGSPIPFIVNRKKLKEQICKITDSYGLALDMDAKVWQLSVGEQQRVEIAKCFYHGAQTLILDEPTSVLTPPEIRELFGMMRRVSAAGCAVVFISHKLNEVMEIADDITVFRKGQLIGTVKKEETSMRDLSQMMVGRNVDLNNVSANDRIGGEVLTVKDLHVNNDKGLEAVKGVSLSIRSGEILGVAAVSGNGQAELSEAIAGLRKIQSGEILVDGQSHKGKSIREIINSGVSSITEKRLGLSLIPGFSIAQNLISKDYMKGEYKKHGAIDQSAIDENARKLIELFDIAAPGPDMAVNKLSGGNVQKVVLARELTRPHKLILAVNPTYGLDVGAIEFVQSKLCEERDRGVGVLLISEELDEVLRLSDRIIVMAGGHIAANLEKKDFDREKIGLIMTGGAEHEAAV